MKWFQKWLTDFKRRHRGRESYSYFLCLSGVKILTGLKSPEKQTESNTYEKFAFIISGKNRILIYKNLVNKPCYAYEIAKKEQLNPTSVVRALKDMERNRIVECLNPRSHRQKYYMLTPEGEILKSLLENYMNH